MEWTTEAGIVRHPSGRGFAIEVALIWMDSAYRGYVTRTSGAHRLKDIPVGHEQAELLMLHFDGVFAYFNARQALIDVEEAMARLGLGGLWPKCLKCHDSLAINNAGIITKCKKCGFENPW